MDITPRDLFILKKTQSNFEKNIESPIKETIVSVVKENEAVKIDNSVEAFETAQFELLVDTGRYYLLNIEDIIQPIRKKEKYTISNDYFFVENFGKKIYKSLGEYSFLSQTDILKNLKVKNISKLTSQEKAEIIKSSLPYRLQLLSDITPNSYFMAKKTKVSDSEVKTVLQRYDLFEPLKKLLNDLKNGEMSYAEYMELKNTLEELINKGENYYLKDTNKNDKEVREFFNYITSYKLKLNTPLTEIKENEYPFLKFKVSDKKLKEFIKMEKISDFEKKGIEKKETFDIFSPIKNIEELQKFEEYLNRKYKKNQTSFLDYIEYVKNTTSKDIRKFIRK